MTKVKVIFYDLPDGSMPAQEFLDSFEIKMQAKMVRTIVSYRRTDPICANHIRNTSRMAFWNFGQKSAPIFPGFCTFSSTAKSHPDAWIYQEDAKNASEGNRPGPPI